ncbi:hypothetical protein [Vibrio sp. V10_P2A27P122]|uniref:hypothetical protein n=1 Tax=Vibrio sp. V10_P2A27P122 TaxID=1938665 RepID=UPI000B8EA341|nr:hypothetical protein B9J83_16550 [Vibrio sp. V07_P2A8T137]OXX57685.1 hypothetical protein B9J82_09745 [Vibrio sp. V10_P2A27P122]PSD42031.1 hypothetical protein C7E22_07815 [Vibrio sp. V02_P2A34T13]
MLWLSHAQHGNSIAHDFNRYTYTNNNPYKYTDLDGGNGFFEIAALELRFPLFKMKVLVRQPNLLL